MRIFISVAILTFSAACAAAGSGGTVRPPAVEASAGPAEHHDENADRAVLCSAERPVDFYENKDYCLGPS